MTSYLNNGYDFMNYFAKFEKFLPHKISYQVLMTVGSQMPELDREGAFLLPPLYKLGSQNTPYKLGLKEPSRNCSQFDNKKPEELESEFDHFDLDNLYPGSPFKGRI